MGLSGVEPLTSSLSATRSNQLSYKPLLPAIANHWMQLKARSRLSSVILRIERFKSRFAGTSLELYASSLSFRNAPEGSNAFLRFLENSEDSCDSAGLFFP